MDSVYRLSGLNPTIVRSESLSDFGSIWYFACVPFPGTTDKFSLEVKQKVYLSFGELEPVIMTVKPSKDKLFKEFTMRIDRPFELHFTVPPNILSAQLFIHSDPDPIQLTYNSFKNMSGQSNPSVSTTDPALLQAVTMLVQTTAQTAAAVVASDEATQNFDNIPLELQLGEAKFFVAGNVNKLTAIDRNCREIIVANNNATGSLKLMAVPAADGTKYADITNITGNPILPGGSFVINEPTSRDEWYIVGSLPNMKVNFTKSVKV
jgi:hypothetical protein